MERKCESCGMPLKEADNMYCEYCVDSDGNLKDFETKFQETVQFVLNHMKLGKAEAEVFAMETMSKQLAWADRFRS